MAKVNKNRPIRFDQFRKQLKDAGLDDLQEVELGPNDEDKVYLRLAFDVDTVALDAFMSRIEGEDDPDTVATIILDYHPDEDISGEDQLQKVHAAGYTSSELIALWGAATGELREKAGKLKPRRS